MPTFARLNSAEMGEASLECAHNRELEVSIGDPDILFFVLGGDTAKKYGVEEDLGEVLLYSPKFVPKTETGLDKATIWVGQSIDFDYSTV